MTNRRAFLSALPVAAAVQLANAQTPAASGTSAKDVHRQVLPEPFAGWEARYVEVTYPAGVATVPHSHPGFVLGYVTEGDYRFAVNGETPTTLPAGQAFYEPPGARHTTGESAVAGKGAKILAIIIQPVEKK